MIETATFHPDRMAAAAADDLIAATDIADLLVRRGVPFRECHGIVAGLVRTAVESGRGLGELTDEELHEASPLLDGEVREVLAQRSWLESKVSEGGTASARVAEQLAAARAQL
jgi:argininosuccinate lyase